MNKVKSKSKASPKPKLVAKDLQPKKEPKGGVLIGLMLPAVQKIREAG